MLEKDFGHRHQDDIVPVIHEYKNDSGIYLRTAIDGTYVTFQVYQSAARFLEKAGYGDGDNVGWRLIKPLWEQGYVYTGKSGTTTQVENHLENRQLNGLENHEKEELNRFFEEQKRRSISVPDDIYSTLREWHNGKYSEERARNLLYAANDDKRCIQSIREFRQRPIDIRGLDTSQGDPAYSVSSKGRELRCVDLRATKRQTDLIITLSGHSDRKQALFIADGDLDGWKVYGPPSDREHRYHVDLLEHFPAIIDLLVDVPDYDLTLDLWDFETALGESLSDEITSCLQLDWEWCTYSVGRSDGVSPRVDGEVALVSPIGFGIVSTDELEKDLVFESTDDVSVNERVTFEVKREDGTTRAVDVLQREDDTGCGTNSTGSTKYGDLIRREKDESLLRNGEPEQVAGTIKTLDRKQGFGYVTAADGQTRYFSTTELLDRGLSPSAPVHFVPSKDGKRALRLEPRNTDDETDVPDDNVSDNRPLESGQKRIGWVQYLNRFYGSLAVEGCSETVLFRGNELPIRHDDVFTGMAFTFETTTSEDGNLRATNLQRESERDRTDNRTETEETPDITPVTDSAENWIIRFATDAAVVFDSIEAATDFGIDPEKYEHSIARFGRVAEVDVTDFSVTEAGDPVYQLAHDDGNWSVYHRLSLPETVLDVHIDPEDGVGHRTRIVDGKIRYWRPALDQGRISTDDRHQFILEQGQYVTMLTEYLELTH